MKKTALRFSGKILGCLLALLLGGRLALDAQTSVHTMTYGGLSRSYRVYLPANYTGTTAVPLVFNLHGYTSNALQQEFYSGMNAVADTAGFIVCYPDGINNSWNSGFNGTYYGGVDDVGFISVLIDSLRSQHNIDPARVYSCGMSNGGFMSYRLACDLETRIAAIASVTGSMTSLQLNNCNCGRPMPVLEIHGTADATVPYNTSTLSMGIDSVLRYWTGQNGCTAPVILDTLPDLVQELSTVTTQSYQGCTDNVEVLHFKIENGGHTWPGASFLIPGAVTNQDIKASVEIWRFFYRFSHPNPVLTGRSEPTPGLLPYLTPNPSHGIVQVMNLEPGALLTLMDATGKEIGRWSATTTSVTLGTEAFATGLYYVHVQQESSRTILKFLLAPR